MEYCITIPGLSAGAQRRPAERRGGGADYGSLAIKWRSSRVGQWSGAGGALLFAREGARIMVSDVNASGGEETVRLIRAAGGDATLHATDVSRAADVEALVQATLHAYGGLHVLYNDVATGTGRSGQLRHRTQRSGLGYHHVGEP